MKGSLRFGQSDAASGYRPGRCAAGLSGRKTWPTAAIPPLSKRWRYPEHTDNGERNSVEFAINFGSSLNKGPELERITLERRNHSPKIFTWRRERDSNPRYPFGYSGFQDRLFQPLTHPSARVVSTVYQQLKIIAWGYCRDTYLRFEPTSVRCYIAPVCLRLCACARPNFWGVDSRHRYSSNDYRRL